MDLEESVVSVYEMVKDSVVSITTVRLLDLFFLVESVKGIGAGFVMDSNGILITNAHVVEGAREIQVTFQDGEVENAKIVDLDRWSDIAFLKVERKDLRPLVLGDSDKLKVGQFVIAVGSPFSHIVGGISVTFG
ncbi:MAG: trypsin, partial [Thermofilum sp. ex4484_79]